MCLYNRAERRRIERGEGRNKPFKEVTTLDEARSYALDFYFHPALAINMDRLYIFINAQCALWMDIRDEFIDDFI